VALSRTAQVAAAARVQHRRVDGQPLILDDPVAELLLGSDCEQLLGLLGSLPAEIAGVLRAAIVARSRVSEDRARAAASIERARYVLLGAGLDSAAWRFGDLDLEVVEVDQAEVLADKRSRAAAAGLAVPPAVRYLSADLATEPMSVVLARATAGASRRTVIAWCGVTQYLSETAISATLKAVAALPSGTELIFTTFLPDERLPEHLRSGGQQIAELAAASGEPFVTRLPPERTAALVSEAGLELVTEMGAPELAELFQNRSDGLEPVEGEHIVIATVG
jgi:methyltransferase (TIGR00027 family)